MRDNNFLVILVWLVLSLGCIPVCSGCGKGAEGILIAATEGAVPGAGEEVTGQQEPTENGTPAGAELSGDSTQPPEAEAPLESEMPGEEFCVYVCGQVKAPGVYFLSRGARICDAIEMAGGFLEEAATDYWNLAQALSDGQMIAVPTKEEAARRLPREENAGSSLSVSGAGAGGNLDGKVNINKASREELMTIPGIGATRAEEILAYRKTNGAFSHIRDIMNVTGIKDGLFQKMEDYITVE